MTNGRANRERERETLCTDCLGYCSCSIQPKKVLSTHSPVVSINNIERNFAQEKMAEITKFMVHFLRVR